MARNRVVIETITCDICGQEIADPIAKRVGLDGTTWELDLCDSDAQSVVDQIGKITANGRKAQPARRPQKASSDDWTYLESLGFKRHRGRKTPAENAALANR